MRYFIWNLELVSDILWVIVHLGMSCTDIPIPVALLEERRPANICLIYTNRDSCMRYFIPYSFYGTQLWNLPGNKSPDVLGMSASRRPNKILNSTLTHITLSLTGPDLVVNGSTEKFKETAVIKKPFKQENAWWFHGDIIIVWLEDPWDSSFFNYFKKFTLPRMFSWKCLFKPLWRGTFSFKLNKRL